MILLGIESSCDETAAAVVEMGDGVRRVRSSIVASQIPLHAVFGGVVPEIANRAHAEAISDITYRALSEAGCTVNDLDAVCVAARPGLVGCLMVGVSFAKSLAYAAGLPLVDVHHIHGHLAANYLTYPDLAPPFLALVASGGHTSLILVKDYTELVTVGRTRDDAAGEAFDKVARLLGIAYPGGAKVDQMAFEGDPSAVSLPSAALRDGTLDFSFSGLKTAVMNALNRARQQGKEIAPCDLAASFTHTAVSSIVGQLARAVEQTGVQTVAIAGGVAANAHLREALAVFANEKKLRLCLPDKSLCGDNGAMIAAQGYFEYLAGRRATSALVPSPTSRNNG